MPLINYVLLALIGSGGAAGLPATTPATTLGPEALVQPNGGVLLSVQETPKKEDRRRTLTTNYTRHKKHSHRHGKKHSTVKHSKT